MPDEVLAQDPSSPSAVPEPVPKWREPRILRVWAATEMWIACVFLVLIFLSVLWQVISRYFPALNWPEVGEIANFSMIGLTFIMVGYLIGRNGHITIQIVDYLVKGRAFVVVKAVSAAVVAVICAVLAWEAYGADPGLPDPDHGGAGHAVLDALRRAPGRVRVRRCAGDRQHPARGRAGGVFNAAEAK